MRHVVKVTSLVFHLSHHWSLTRDLHVLCQNTLDIYQVHFGYIKKFLCKLSIRSNTAFFMSCLRRMLRNYLGPTYHVDFTFLLFQETRNAFPLITHSSLIQHSRSIPLLAYLAKRLKKHAWLYFWSTMLSRPSMGRFNSRCFSLRSMSL